MIYFIQAADGTGPIKIGYANNIRLRFSQIQVGCPVILTILKVLDIDDQYENRIHAHFAHLRLHGEWFTPADELLEFIKNPVELPKVKPSLKPRPRPSLVSINEFGGDEQLYSASLASKYIKSNLPEGENWSRCYQGLAQHRKRGHITAVPTTKDDNHQILFYRKSDLDRLLDDLKQLKYPVGLDFTPILDRLGKEPDTELAKEIMNHRTGQTVSPWTIFRLRHRLGIPPYDPSESANSYIRPNYRKPGRQWADVSELEDRLGIVPDKALSRESGISVAAIRRARVARGIPPVPREGRPKGSYRRQGF